MSENTRKRPGLVSFVALMMILVGGLGIVTAAQEFSGATWLEDVVFGLFGRSMVTWGIIDVIIAVASLVAGIGIWRGSQVGRWIGIVFAMIGIIRWSFFLPFEPVAALIVIGIDLLVLYGLTEYEAFFL